MLMVAALDPDKTRLLLSRGADAKVRSQSRVDAVTIAVPTDRHRDITLPLLRAGVPALVEKPIARTLAEADEMIAAARQRKTKVIFACSIIGVGRSPQEF